MAVSNIFVLQHLYSFQCIKEILPCAFLSDHTSYSLIESILQDIFGFVCNVRLMQNSQTELCKSAMSRKYLLSHVYTVFTYTSTSRIPECGRVELQQNFIAALKKMLKDFDAG
jgi:hypothetical protein